MKEEDKQRILCYVCLGSGFYIHRNYLYKEVGREQCYCCGGVGTVLIDKL